MLSAIGAKGFCYKCVNPSWLFKLHKVCSRARSCKMETHLFRHWRPEVDALEVKLKSGNVNATIESFLGPRESVWSGDILEKHEDLARNLIQMKSTLNPKAFRDAFMKFDSIFNFNLSGAVSYASRAEWAKRNGDALHSLWSRIMRHARGKNDPRSPVLRRRKSAYHEKMCEDRDESFKPLDGTTCVVSGIDGVTSLDTPAELIDDDLDGDADSQNHF